MTPSHTDQPHRQQQRLRHTAIAGAVTVILAVIAASCGSGGESETVTGGSSDGAALYESNCASCHGSDLRGTDTGPSHLSIVYEPGHHGDDSFRSAIINGAQRHHWDFGDMDAIPDLDDDQIDAIIGFVRSEQERQGFER